MEGSAVDSKTDTYQGLEENGNLKLWNECLGEKDTDVERDREFRATTASSDLDMGESEVHASC